MFEFAAQGFAGTMITQHGERNMLWKRTIVPALVLLAGLSAAGLSVAGSTAAGEDVVSGVSAEVLLAAGETVLGQAFAYPADAAPKVTAVIATMPPGAESGFHHHNSPLFAYILEGELTVTYDGAGERVFRAGDSQIEAIGTPHNGRNSGSGPLRILAVFIGAEGIPNTIEEE